MKLAGEPPAGLKSLLRPSHSTFFPLRGRHSLGEGLSSGEQRRQTTVRRRARSNPRRWIEELRDANGVKRRGASGRGPDSSSPIIDRDGLVVEVLASRVERRSCFYPSVYRLFGVQLVVSSVVFTCGAYANAVPRC